MAKQKLAQTKKSRSKRAGLILSVPRVERILRKNLYFRRVSEASIIFLTAVLQHLSYELLALSANIAQVNKKKIIKPRHIMLAISCDYELNKLLSHVTIVNGGVEPKVEPELLPKTVPKNQKH